MSRVFANFPKSTILLSVRFYRRAVSRRPVRVIMPDGSVVDSSGRPKLEKQAEDSDLYTTRIQHTATQRKNSYRPIPSRILSADEYRQQDNRTDSSDGEEMRLYETGAEIGGRVAKSGSKLNKKEVIRVGWSKSRQIPKLADIPEYTKLVEENKEFRSTMFLLKSRKHREKTGKILLEGKRLITDAILAKIELETIYFSLEKNIVGIPFPGKGEKIYKVMYKQMQIWSDLQNCPGVMAVFKKPSCIQVQESLSLPLTIICDNIREPGNLGAILRCAAAVGCQEVILTIGCVDLWDPKVLRSGSGAHFRIPVHKNIRWEYVCNYVYPGSKVILADNSMAAAHRHSTEIAEVRDTQDHATSRELTYELDEDGNKVLVDSSYEEPEEVEKCKQVKLDMKYYHEIDYTDTHSHVVLVVGGETEGLSGEANKLAVDHFGERVVIPLKNGVESLNVATALGVILFEIQRQFATRHQTQVQN